MADKAREKLIAKVVKEGGKKGVEIEGAADMARCPGSRGTCVTHAPLPKRSS